VDENQAAETAEQFVSLSLAQRDQPEGSIRLHGLQLDFVRAQYPKEDKETLELIHGAVRLSANVIARDPDQFASQMLGRLLMHLDVYAIDLFTKKVVQGTNAPWLRPLLPTLYPPGLQVRWMLRVFDRAPVSRLLVSSDETTIAVITAEGIRSFSAFDGSSVDEALAQASFTGVDWHAVQTNLPKEVVGNSDTWSNHVESEGVKVGCTINRRTNNLRTNPRYEGGVSILGASAAEKEVLLEGSEPSGTTVLERGFTAPAISSVEDWSSAVAYAAS
jgi:hypothetical protein